MATVRIDPRAVSCPLCPAGVGEGCVRVSEDYGEGNPLRRQHTVRFRAAEARAQAATRRAVRRAG